MTAASLVRLFVLAALWGASFLFMRVAVPAFGPVWLIGLRVSIAAAFLLLIAGWRRQPLPLRGNVRHYFISGLFTSALPFLCYAFAARTLSASLMSILNATAPFWGTLVAALWLRVIPTRKAWLGLALGVIGVATLVGFDRITAKPGAGLAIAACLTATLCYGFASAYSKRYMQGMASFNVAHGSMWGASLALLPCLLLVPTVQPFSSIAPQALAAVSLLAIFCTGVAYLLYFRLISDIGPASALTVTFLIPVFGVLWGVMLLDESVGLNTLAGALLVLLGTGLVTGFSPAVLRRKA
ncbi:EamA-like transporter family protein [Andreprevotia lacus DSM 23236]|jgi:drug/metabolite transporter (DMT)-like permease|uniref:EamA-like transporter family protein n=1 Tax=Andreprevotia lacus DSM 23236 TaxID=1121001 RepID=A0A1W1XBD1_9NEIS|nr:DMT family transporter [Andreprevotia lacus]SMC21180.1 EamA-like transporter family protein [Andreprevotia lacus DSM 23236]